MYNKVLLIGTVAQPVTIKQINPNLQMGILSITVQRSYIKQLEEVTESSIVDCDLWGKQIEEANKFAPGSKIIVEGRLKVTRKPNIKTGGEFSFISVTVERITDLNAADNILETEKIQNNRRAFEESSRNEPGYQQAPTFTDLPF